MNVRRHACMSYYVCMYACTYVYMHIRMRRPMCVYNACIYTYMACMNNLIICMYSCVNVFFLLTCAHMYMYCMNTMSMYVCASVCMRTCIVYVCAYVCMNVCWFACDSLCVVAVILCAATFRAGGIP